MKNEDLRETMKKKKGEKEEIASKGLKIIFLGSIL